MLTLAVLSDHSWTLQEEAGSPYQRLDFFFKLNGIDLHHKEIGLHKLPTALNSPCVHSLVSQRQEDKLGEQGRYLPKT